MSYALGQSLGAEGSHARIFSAAVTAEMLASFVLMLSLHRRQHTANTNVIRLNLKGLDLPVLNTDSSSLTAILPRVSTFTNFQYSGSFRSK